MKATIPTTMRELHSRVNDGIHVRLLWSEREGRRAVAVTDTRTGEAFCIEVRDGEKALEVFNHPFAYAAFHGVDTAGTFAADASDMPLAA
jgi:enolase